MTLDQHTTNQQLTLLAVHRRTLAALLQQLALLGGTAFAAPGVLNSIEEARGNIAYIKAFLRENDVLVDDVPNDETPPATSLATTIATHSIAEQQALDKVLETYIDWIELQIIDKGLLASSANSNIQHIALTRTLAVLRRLDGEHNQRLVLFLRDAGLLGGLSAPIIDLKGTNQCRVDLRGVSLQGINLQGANLQGADLRGANLQEADLRGANVQRRSKLKPHDD